MSAVMLSCATATTAGGSAPAHRQQASRVAAPAPDTDRDGLSDAAEARHHTNPRKPDTDRDSLPDGAEVNAYHTNPRKPDTDGDSLLDGDEVNKHKTNPRKRDTDGDGFGDRVELRGGTNPRNARSHLGFPDASTTGVPPGTSLTPRSGNLTVSTNNAVVDGISMSGCITVTGYGVTIKNSNAWLHRCRRGSGRPCEPSSHDPGCRDRLSDRRLEHGDQV